MINKYYALERSSAYHTGSDFCCLSGFEIGMVGITRLGKMYLITNASAESSQRSYQAETRHPPVKQQFGNLLLYLRQKGEQKRGQVAEVCQSHKGNGHSPLGRLGKHGIREGSKVVHHRRDRPLPGRLYRCILSRFINSAPHSGNHVVNPPPQVEDSGTPVS